MEDAKVEGDVVRGEDVWARPETRYISVGGATLFNLQLDPVDCARNAITTAWNPCWCWVNVPMYLQQHRHRAGF